MRLFLEQNNTDSSCQQTTRLRPTSLEDVEVLYLAGSCYLSLVLLNWSNYKMNISSEWKSLNYLSTENVTDVAL